MDIIREESVQITNKKIGFLEKKINEDIIEINKKLELIPSGTLLCDYEKKINTMIEQYNKDINDIKDNINFRLSNLEKDFEFLKEIKSPNRNNSEKKAKVSFSNIISYKTSQFKKIDEAETNQVKSSNSSKNIKKYYSLNINKYNKDLFNNTFNNNNKTINKNEQNINLDNINEVYEENNDINDNDTNDNNDNSDSSPLNNMVFSSLNFSSHNIKKKILLILIMKTQISKI